MQWLIDNWFLGLRWVLLVVLVLGLIYRARHRVHWPWVTREVALALGCYFLYFLVRGLTSSDEDQAIANAGHIIDIERTFGLLHEDWLQSHIVEATWKVNLANWSYIWGHWPFILVVASWLVLYHPAQYHVTRNAFLVSGAVGLVVFAVFPVAPPRLVPELGLVDTVTEHSSAYRVLQPPAFVNQYAAMPSLHFGWNLLVGIALLRVGRGPARILGALVPPVMLFGVVATANHFYIDAIAGGLLCVAALVGVEVWERRKPEWAAWVDQRLLPRHPGRHGSR